MNPSKRVFSLALATAAVLGAGGVHAQTALDDIMKAKEIKIAIPTDFPPYGMVGTDLKPQGLDVEMAGYIAQNSASRLNWCPSPAPTASPTCKPKKPTW
jgi:polar amino acid transport system substrate-binding protein